MPLPFCRWLQPCSLLLASIISFCSMLCTTGYRLRWNVNGKAVTSTRKINLHTHHKSNTLGPRPRRQAIKSTDVRAQSDAFKNGQAPSILWTAHTQTIRRNFLISLSVSIRRVRFCTIPRIPIDYILYSLYRCSDAHRCEICARFHKQCQCENKDVHEALWLQWKVTDYNNVTQFTSISRGCSAVFPRTDKKDNMFVVCVCILIKRNCLNDTGSEPNA